MTKQTFPAPCVMGDEAIMVGERATSDCLLVPVPVLPPLRGCSAAVRRRVFSIRHQFFYPLSFPVRSIYNNRLPKHTALARSRFSATFAGDAIAILVCTVLLFVVTSAQYQSFVSYHFSLLQLLVSPTYWLAYFPSPSGSYL